MKKINKTRKITENDLRNLHYIHENEGLIPDGVTKLEDEDITSAEVITEDKKFKVNESAVEKYTVDDYLNDFENLYVSISYKKVLAYKKKRDEMSDDEYQKLNKQYEDLEQKISDLQDRVNNGELTQDEASKLGDKWAAKLIKLYRKISGGLNPDWYEEEDKEIDPDLIAKEKEEGVDIEKIKKEGDKENPSPKEFTEKDYEKFCESYRVSLPYEKVKSYREKYDAFTDRQEEKAHDKEMDLYYKKKDLEEKLEKGEITQEEYDKVMPGVLKKHLKAYQVSTGGTDPEWYDPNTMQDIDPDINKKANEAEAIYNIDFWTDKKNPDDIKEETNSILRMLGYPSDPNQSDLEEIIRHFDIDYNGDSDYEEYIVTLLGYYYLMFGRTEFYKNYVSKYGVVVVNESSVETNNQYWEFVQKFKESMGEDSEIYKELMTQLQAIKDYDVHAAYNLTKEFLENKGLWDQYSSDFEAIPVNEDDMDEFRKLIDSDVWKKFKEDWKGTDVYDAAMDAISYVDTLPQMVNGLKRVFNAYDILVDYETDLDKLLSTSVNEYKTVGVYKPNDGEVEDLYYIQAGDIILIHHKDYGELQCKVKKVDADKNKVYFVTIERGIMGVCGFDKIHGIQLVEECQKQPMFVQTKHIKFPEGGMCYMCYAKVGSRFVDVYCTFGMSLDNCECIKLLNMTADEFGIIDNIMSESDTVDDAKNRVYNSGLVSL